MQEIPFHIREKIRTYAPIEEDGLVFYPIQVRELGHFKIAQPAIDFLQQSLPVRYLSMPLLSAYYTMDFESRQKGEPVSGLFSRALLFLVLSLRYRSGEPLEERLDSFASHIKVAAEDPSTLKAIEFEMGGETKRITPIQFQRYRPILAAQNGIELVSEDANPELVEAERDIAEQNGPELDGDVQTMISTVAALCGADEVEIDDWPILKLKRRKEAWERAFGFLLYGFAECSGAKFKGGNPVPSLFYNRARRESNSLISMESFTKGQQVSVSPDGPPPGITPDQTNP